MILTDTNDPVKTAQLNAVLKHIENKENKCETPSNSASSKSSDQASKVPVNIDTAESTSSVLSPVNADASENLKEITGWIKHSCNNKVHASFDQCALYMLYGYHKRKKTAIDHEKLLRVKQLHSLCSDNADTFAKWTVKPAEGKEKNTGFVSKESFLELFESAGEINRFDWHCLSAFLKYERTKNGNFYFLK